MGSYIILALPLLATLVALLLRRWPRAVLVVGFAATLIIWFLLFITQTGVGSLASGDVAGSVAAEGTTLFLGLAPELTSGVRALLLWLYPALALVFLLAWLQEEAPVLIPSALAATSLLTAALLIQPISFGAFLLIPLAIVLLPVLDGGRTQGVASHPNAAAAGLRFLLFVVLPLPLLLLVQWMVESGQGTQSSALFGFLLASLMLLAGFPFTVWVTAVARHSLLSALPLLLGLIQMGVVLFLFMILNEAPVLGRGEPFRQLLQWSAVATTLLAALLLHRAADWREVIGRLSLLDMGLLLLTIAMPNPDTMQAALWLLAGRFVSLMLACSGLSLWQQHETGVRLTPGLHNNRHARWSAGLLIYGCLSLLGLPLTPGFGGHWLVLTQATAGLPWLAAVLFLALAIAALALGRMVWPIFSPDHDVTTAQQDEEPRRIKWLVGAAVLLGLLMTFLPSLLGRYATQIASSFH